MMTRLILVAVVNALTLTLAACGGGGDGRLTITHPDPDMEQFMQAVRTWRCYASSDFWKAFFQGATPLVDLYRFTHDYMGVPPGDFGLVRIHSGEVVKAAVVRSVGLNLQWDFSDLDIEPAYTGTPRDLLRDVMAQHRYTFVLEPDGTGLYYDFSTSDDGTAKASQIFQCLRS